MSSLIQHLEHQKIDTKIQTEIKKNLDSHIIIQSHTEENLKIAQSISVLERNLVIHKTSLLLATFDNNCSNLSIKITDLYGGTKTSVTLHDNNFIENIIDSLKDYVRIYLPDILSVKEAALLTKEEVILKKEEALNYKPIIKNEIKSDYSRTTVPYSSKPNSTLISPKGDDRCLLI
jgi:hypothetical protein